jgi:hypothetical protein
VQALVSNAPTAAEAEGLLGRVTALENALALVKADNAQLRAQVQTISDQLGIALPQAATL